MDTKVAVAGMEQGAPPEARLWQAVLMHSIEEWVSGPLRQKREAEKFLFDNNSDFRLVCESAGMDAEYLRAKLVRLRKQAELCADCQVAA